MIKTNFEPLSIDESKPWNKTSLNKELLNQDYTYFENITIKTKNKTKPLLAQLLNPEFSSKTEICYDPWNGAAIDSTANLALSFYIMKDGDEAVSEISRRKYDDQFAPFWGCVKVEEMDTEWSTLLTYTTIVNKT